MSLQVVSGKKQKLHLAINDQKEKDWLCRWSRISTKTFFKAYTKTCANILLS